MSAPNPSYDRPISIQTQAHGLPSSDPLGPECPSVPGQLRSDPHRTPDGYRLRPGRPRHGHAEGSRREAPHLQSRLAPRRHVPVRSRLRQDAPGPGHQAGAKRRQPLAARGRRARDRPGPGRPNLRSADRRLPSVEPVAEHLGGRPDAADGETAFSSLVVGLLAGEAQNSVSA